MTADTVEEPTFSVAIGAGIALVAVAIVRVVLAVLGLPVEAGGYDLAALAAGALVLVFAVWGLLSATKGSYRRGVGSLSASAGLTMLFLAPQAQSEALFVGTGALIVFFSGVFLIAIGFGYEIVAVDDRSDGAEAEFDPEN